MTARVAGDNNHAPGHEVRATCWHVTRPEGDDSLRAIYTVYWRDLLRILNLKAYAHVDTQICAHANSHTFTLTHQLTAQISQMLLWHLYYRNFLYRINSLLLPLNYLGPFADHYCHCFVVVELSFSRISESTTCYTFTPCVGYVTSPGIDTR